MNSNLKSAEQLLRNTYQYFNDRDIDKTLAGMAPDVDWPNAMEGGTEHGHEAIRNYWTRQWLQYNPRVDPINFETEPDGRINVTVHQVVHDVSGKLLVDQTIHHVYTIENGLVTNMEIRNN